MAELIDTPPLPIPAREAAAPIPRPTIYAGLDAWMIRWQLFGDISAGTNLAISIEIMPHAVRRARHEEPGLLRHVNCFYRLSGRVRRSTRAGWVVDSAIPVHCTDALPAGIEVGMWVEIDGSLWFDRTGGGLSSRETIGSPARWRVTSLYRDTDLWRVIRSVENQPIREGGWLPKPDNPAHAANGTGSAEPVGRTNARSDDEGSAHYLVALEYLGTLPGFG